MDIKAATVKIINFIKKYKYVMLVILIGIVLMLIPNVSTDTKEPVSETIVHTQTEPETEKRLAIILSRVQGAGAVEVMLSISAGEEIVYQMDSATNENGENSDIKINTVLVSDNNRNEQGLVQQINPPTYLGAIIVCEGADDPAVQLAIVDAVSKITGLGTHHISVLKMK